MKATQRQTTQPAVDPADEPLPAIRSSELFTMDDAGIDEYLDLMASVPTDAVPMEAVLGTNGAARSMTEAGAYPAETRHVFNEVWESMDYRQRRDALFGNAVARYCMDGVDDAARAMSAVSMATMASAVTGGSGTPEDGFMASGDPGLLANMSMKAMFGVDPTGISQGAMP